MSCIRSADIQDLVDGTLGRFRAAELQQHIDQCDECRALARDLQKVRDAAQSLEPLAPPDHVWLQIAGRLRQEGRVQDRPKPESANHRPYVWLAIAAALVIAVGASLISLLPRGTSSPVTNERAAEGNAEPSDAVQSGVEDLRNAERLLQSGLTKLKEGLGSDQETLPAAVTATLDSNLEILDRTIVESNTAFKQDPQNVAARNSLFNALQRKITLLQDTISLMNEIRKGNAAGIAQVIDSGGNKS